MDGLRWLLLAVGGIVIVAVYVYSRREAAKAKSAGTIATRVEPQLTGADVPAETDAPPLEPEMSGADEQIAESAGEPGGDGAPVDRPQKIVTLRVVAKNRGSFRGDKLILCMRGIGLRHGKFGIFHRHEGDDTTSTIFSAASLVEPGSFELSNLKEQQIPGISLFAVLPGPIDGADAFDLMMAAARAIAQSLDGELLDESGSTLSIQRERYLREEIIQFEHAGRASS